MKILHAGATGLVGRHVLSLLLSDPRVTAVVAPTRRALPLPHPRLSNPRVDFEHLPEDAQWWRVDAVICTLGSTIRQAGSREAFHRIDHDYPLAVGRIAHRHGARTYALNSAMGADPRSRIFYSRVKGELEAGLRTVGFDSLTFVRPGLIGGERTEFRLGEHLATIALRAAAPLVPRRYRINPAARIAEVLVQSALEATPGTHVVASDALT